PCGRLSRPLTTTGTPCPWGSRPVGHLAFRALSTFRTAVGAPFVSLRWLMPPTPRRSAGRPDLLWSASRGDTGRQPPCPARTFSGWALGFNQCRLHHTVRISHGHALGGFAHAALLGYAIVPSGFRLQVGPTIQEDALTSSRVTRGSKE